MTKHEYQIELTQGKFAIVDEEDYEMLTTYKWFAHKDHYGCWYALRSKKIPKSRKSLTIRMHRMILNCPPGMQIDHINGDGLDNRKCNLRLCTPSQNQANRVKKSKTSSRFKGVGWVGSVQRWRAYLRVNGKRIYAGDHKTEIEAARAYNEKATEVFGDFAKLNDVREVWERWPKSAL